MCNKPTKFDGNRWSLNFNGRSKKNCWRYLQEYIQYIYIGAKGDWGFQISDLVKNPDGTDI